jgi:hypothetical protein
MAAVESEYPSSAEKRCTKQGVETRFLIGQNLPSEMLGWWRKSAALFHYRSAAFFSGEGIIQL